MTVDDQIQELMSRIPRLHIQNFPAGFPIPNIKAVKPLIPYNGFSGHARMRTWEVAKWLIGGGKMPAPSQCDLCDGKADQYHAENYFDFASYIPVCRSCHGKVHSRLRNFATFEIRRAEWNKPTDHWINYVGEAQFPVAEWSMRSGHREPTFGDFVDHEV